VPVVVLDALLAFLPHLALEAFGQVRQKLGETSWASIITVQGVRLPRWRRTFLRSASFCISTRTFRMPSGFARA